MWIRGGVVVQIPTGARWKQLASSTWIFSSTSWNKVKQKSFQIFPIDWILINPVHKAPTPKKGHSNLNLLHRAMKSWKKRWNVRIPHANYCPITTEYLNRFWARSGPNNVDFFHFAGAKKWFSFKIGWWMNTRTGEGVKQHLMINCASRGLFLSVL